MLGDLFGKSIQRTAYPCARSRSARPLFRPGGLRPRLERSQHAGRQRRIESRDPQHDRQHGTDGGHDDGDLQTGDAAADGRVVRRNPFGGIFDACDSPVHPGFDGFQSGLQFGVRNGFHGAIIAMARSNVMATGTKSSMHR